MSPILFLSRPCAAENFQMTQLFDRETQGRSVEGHLASSQLLFVDLLLVIMWNQSVHE
jgi:hypothetical protein